MKFRAFNHIITIQRASAVEEDARIAFARQIDETARSGATGSFFARRVKAYKDATGAGLSESISAVKEMFEDRGRGKVKG